MDKRGIAVTKEEKIEILAMYNVKGLNVSEIARQVGRSRPAVQRVIDNDQNLFTDVDITERIRDEILKSIEKHNVYVNETSGMIMKALRKEADKITRRESLTAADINMLLNINKQIQMYQTKALENSEKINMNKKELELKGDDDQGITALADAISNFGKR